MGSHMSSPTSSHLVNSPATSGANWPMPSPPWGPVPTSTRRRTRSGRSSATSWAVSPPIEWPINVDGGEAKSIDERSGVGGHYLLWVGRATRAAAHTGVIEQDDLAAHRERVADRGVEVVEIAHQVLREDDGGTGGLPEAPVGEPIRAYVYETG